jgi:poly(glycerol-phosphate) alpha-glucosyltransferase
MVGSATTQIDGLEVNTASVVGSISRKAGGLFESVRRLHQSLAELQGVHVRVFGLRDEFTEADIGQWAPVTIDAYRVRGPKSFGYAPEMRQQLLLLDLEIIHVHGIWQYPSVAALAWYRKYRRPYMISPHGMLDQWAVRNSAWKKIIARMSYEGTHLRSAACIRALCESEAQAIRAYGLGNPICIIPNGIDLPELGATGPKADDRSPKTEEQEHPVKLLKKRGRKVLLYFGRVHPKKGLPNLLRAWHAVPKSEEWVLAIAGWGQGGHEDELKQLATELGLTWCDTRAQQHDNSQLSTLNSQLVFIGPQFNEDKAACYRDCDAFILPSFSEGLPMVVLEAWAYAKPVLMTPECNLPEGYAANAAVRIHTDVESIAAGLSAMLRASSFELAALGSHGRALVSERFTWGQIAKEMKNVYDWLLGAGPRPGCIWDK